MFGFSESHDAYEKVQQGHHASLSHEAIAAAASFEVDYIPPARRHMRSGFLSITNAFHVGHEGIRGPPTQRG